MIRNHSTKPLVG